MRLRSLLFVPGDRPERFDKAAASGADALILDLEDGVAPERKEYARAAVAERLARGPGGPALFVRINPIGSELAEADLAAVLEYRPDGIMLPKAEGRRSIERLCARLGREQVPILPIATETPAALFRIGEYGEVAERLCGIGWGAEDLPAAIGAISAREAGGRYTAPYEMVRALALFGAHAAGVAAIEAIYPAFRDAEGLAAYAARGRRDGFTGMMAIHPAQVPVINQAFTPGAEELAEARAIVALFAADPGAGVLSLDGRMVDAPHLARARRLLASMGEDISER
ncbi:CoA ester lyase [Sphingomonas oleivorans]|uniref:CoA ester lyase n=1 Tax=Sphingomonas oleivorans TaxID=1735121 RepID=A0A2T5G0D9_9SPHN|nr:CoA ester lyase [Sphingomonas oleivorans]PTQ12432.1 CoA ester lyase [Sphingomonas oleivorans]